ncbi:MAG: PAS domain S-box protein [Methanoregula sp.]
MKSASGDLIPASFVLPLITGATIATVALTLYCFSHGISTVFMHFYYLPIILIAYFYRRRGIPVFTGLALFYLALAAIFLYPSTIEIGTAVLRTGMFILIGVVVAELSERLEKKKEDHRVAHEYQKSIVDNANVWLMVLDPRGVIIEWNRAAEEMSGYSAKDVVGGNTIWKLLYPEREYRREITEKITGIITRDNYLENLQTTIVTKNGTKKVISWNTRGLADSEGTIRNYIAIGVDITEQKRAEMELSGSEKKFHTIADFTTDWEYWQGQDKRIIYMTPSCHHITGYTQQEFLADPMLLESIVHPDDLLSVHNHNLEAWESRNVFSLDFRIIHRDGTVRWIGHACRQVYDDEKRALGRRVSNRDITDRKLLEIRLIESEGRLKEILESMIAGVVIINPETHTIIDVNSVAAKMIGAEKNEIIGSVCHRYICPAEIGACPITDLEQIVDKSEKKLLTHHGEKIPIIKSVVNIQINKRPYLLESFIDISDLKQAEKALMESEKRFDQLAEQSNTVAWEVDARGLYTYVSHVSDAVWGYSPDELVGRMYFYDLHPESGREAFKNACFAVFEHKEPFQNLENAIQTRDGREVWVSTNGSPLLNADGTLRGYRGSDTDITDRKRAEEALQLTNALLTSQMETTIDGTLVVDETGKVISYNQRFTEIWEIPPEVIASRSDEQLLQSVFSKISNPEEFLTRVQYLYAHREEESREEIRLNDKRTLDRYSAPLIGNDGRYYGRIWYFRNITERKLAEEALRQANRQLNLLSSITRHDILNQLMALKGYLELSHEVIDNPSTLIEYIKKEEKAANTIEHQITFTKDYQNLGVAAPEWQNVNASINKALSGLPMRDVRVEVDPNNPEIFADRLFEKVFYNLIDNALRYGGADMKTIRVSSQEIDTGLRIVCEDDGVGISAEDKKRLFNRGFGKNTGLGLFLSREILAITGITITEKGIPGKGARFEITVPKGAWRMKRLDA